MSVMFSIIPVDEQFDNEDSKEWLDQNGLTLPTKWNKGYTPSIRQIQASIEKIPNLRIQQNITESTWHINISDGKFHLEFDSPFSGNIDDLYSGGLRGSFDLMVEVINELVKLCGTQIILSEGEDPILFVCGGYYAHSM